jgi:acyl-CoA synthetase (AMP-forming)/AMP-acid ligase II
MTSFNLADLFELVADAVPDREALVCGGRRLTYRELDERATRLANHLRSQGIGKGDHIGLYLYNGTEYLEGALAAYKLGACAININYRYVEEELEYLFDNADLVALIHHREFAPRIAAVAAKMPKLRTFLPVEDGTTAGPGVRFQPDTGGGGAGDVVLPSPSGRGAGGEGMASSTTKPPSPPPPPTATSRRAQATTSTSSTPAAPPACRRASCGGMRTCSSRR